MDSQQILAAAAEALLGLRGHTIDVLSVTPPSTIEEAVNLSLIVSKLSPIIGNLIEFKTVGLLNEMPCISGLGKWVRQDPDFPDTLFVGKVEPKPGFEIKAWFPLATEITARFKDSQTRFAQNNTWVAVPAWLPSQLICGKPMILDVCIVSGASLAKARDDHYHKPPYYIVVEPENTTDRTKNLQQTNTSGYVWQDTPGRLAEATQIVESWGGGKLYCPHPDYQALLRELQSKFKYRLDTNFAKMDRVVHTEIEAFKTKVLGTKFLGKTVGDWARLISRVEDGKLRSELARLLGLDLAK